MEVGTRVANFARAQTCCRNPSLRNAYYIYFNEIKWIYNYESSSNSIFPLMGASRFIAQSISYEVRFISIIFRVIILSESYSLIDLKI